MDNSKVVCHLLLLVSIQGRVTLKWLDLKVASMNVQGLGNYEKRRDVFNYLRQKCYSIYLLQDTHFDKQMENRVRSEWGYECYFASFSTQSRGVAILFNNTFDFKVKSVISDAQGNYIILTITTMDRDLTVVNIYGPNRDDPNFFRVIQDKLQTIPNSSVIAAGDWNLVLNPDLDYYNYRHTNNPKAQDKVYEIMNNLVLADIWREINPEVRRFTWRRPNPLQQSRLDFFLVSENLLSYTKDADILTGYRTDHSLISLELEFKKKSKQKTFWKFNSSHLKDRAFAEKINKTIRQTKEQYAALVYNRQFIENIPIAELTLTISDQLFLDTLFMEIRKASIEYSVKKKKENVKEEQSLEEEILILERKTYKSDVDIQQIQIKKDALTEFRKSKMDGVLLRSRATFACRGEKVTKYYCNMENRHFVSKQMFKIVSSTGELLEHTEDIVKETKGFYCDLYKRKGVDQCQLTEYVPSLPRLNEMESESLEGLITLEEATIALQNMKNGKSPGTDGMTVEFFKFFWNYIGGFVVRSLNEGFKKVEYQ